MGKVKRLSFIIPVYNEKKNIIPTTEAILSTFDKYKEDLEILFVDDNSPDGTAEEIESVETKFSQVKLVQHGKKEGIGAAHLFGYENAEGEYILCIDADLSQDPADLLKMKEKLDKGKDMVIGSRYAIGGEMVGKSILRDVGSRGMNLIAKVFLGLPTTDTTHTFRAFRKSVFNKVSDKINQKGHPSFQVQFTFWVRKEGFDISEIPIRFVERDDDRGESKLSIKKEIIPFLKIIGNLTLKRFSKA